MDHDGRQNAPGTHAGGDGAAQGGPRPCEPQLQDEVARRERAERQLAGALERTAALKARIDAVVADLEKREARTRQIINTSEDAFFETDIAGEITDWNTTAERLFGYPRAEVLGRSITLVCRPEASAGSSEGGLPAILEAIGEHRRGELVGVRKDGTSIPIELSVGMLIDDDAFCFTAFAHDISQRKSEQAQRMRAQKLESIGQLAAGIAHEINTPTQYIRDNLEFLRDTFEEARPFVDAAGSLIEAASGDAGDAQIAERARRAEEARSRADIDYAMDETPRAIAQALEGVQRVAEIVRAMKEFAHPGTGEPQPVDLNRAIESTTIVCRNEWKHSAKLELDLDATLPPVVCLPGEMNQVVLNLVVNAAHAVDAAGRGEAGRIVVGTRLHGSAVQIRVADNGTGISPEHRERIFDPFFTTKPVGRGTGQGLALVHSIVEKHGGSISLETTPGSGTTFTVTIPLSPTGAAGVREAAA